MVTMPLRMILSLTLLVLVQPAQAEDGFFDALFGGSTKNTPPNPFASNYPSAPPAPASVREERDRRAARTARASASEPMPPGRIPE